jgi:C4-dicarboxylate-specific signal transduction histidine kinase
MILRAPSRLSWKLLAAIIPAVVLVVGAIVWLQYAMARKEISAAIDKETASIAQRLSMDVDDVLEQRRRDVATLAETPLIADYYRNVDFGLHDEAKTYRAELERYLKGFAERTGDYQRIAFLDASGYVVAGAGKPAKDPALSRARDEAFVAARASGRGGLWTSSIEDRPGRGPSIYFLKPVHDERGRFRGALGLSYGLESLRARLAAAIGRGGRAYLETDDGRRLEGRSAKPAGDVLAARARLRSRPWTVVVEAPADDFFAPLRKVRDATLATAVLGMAVLVGILLLAVGLMTRPIAALVEAARRVGAGDFGHRIPKPGSDELGTLSAAFNEMGERLEANRARNEQLQGQLVQAEKLSAVGQLISAVAHELNNPLAAISGYVQIAMTESDASRLREDLDHVGVNVKRCRKVVDNLLFFVRKSRQERGRVDLNAAALSALELLEYRLVKTEDVRVVQDLAAAGPVVVGDFQQIVQVVVNLVSNACDAMDGVVRWPDGKRLLVATGTEGARGFIRIEDNGPGVAPEAEGRLFEAFFTTKEPGRGTGLGLSICRQIVREHGGDISFENRPGRGCAFRVELPLGSEAEFDRLEGEEEPPALPAVPGRRVLVADDEADVAEVIARVMREDGDEVAVAHSGAEALRLLESGRFDLVISDMEMEKVKGPDVLKKVAESGANPPAKVLFVTGDILNPKVLEFLSRTGAPYLPKPFDIEELRQAARRLLAPRA